MQLSRRGGGMFRLKIAYANERLTAYNAFEAEMNERYGYASDCSVPNEPVLAYRNGRCVAE